MKKHQHKQENFIKCEFTWKEQKKKPKLYKNWKLYAISLPIIAASAGTVTGVYYGVSNHSQKVDLKTLNLDVDLPSLGAGTSEAEVLQAFLKANANIPDLKENITISNFKPSAYGVEGSYDIVATSKGGYQGVIHAKIAAIAQTKLEDLDLDTTVVAIIGASQEEIFQAFLDKNQAILKGDLSLSQVNLTGFEPSKYVDNSLTVTTKADGTNKWTGKVELNIKYVLTESNFPQLLRYLSDHNLLQFEIPVGFIKGSLTPLWDAANSQLRTKMKLLFEYDNDITDISLTSWAWNWPDSNNTPTDEQWNTSGFVLNLPKFAGWFTLKHSSGATTKGPQNFQLNVYWKVLTLDQLSEPYAIEKEILQQENRSFQHSYLTPTGYFLEKGKEYRIKINKTVQANDSVYLSIGQYGAYQGLNDGNSVGFETKQIIGNQVIITPQNSGMLYLKDYRFTNEVKILTISNDPIKVPTFVVDETNQADFFNEIATTKSFFVEVISQHVFGTFQTQMFKNQVIPVKGVDINKNVSTWDKVWEYTNEVYDLDPNSSGTNKKYPQFIQIANPDTGAGYAYATNYYVSFQKQTNAGRDLFTNDISGQWGLWHEIGHTYQTPQYNWSGLTEVTVNISSLYVQQKLVGANRLDQAGTIAKMQQLFATSPADKDYNKEPDLFVKVAMFWQLQMAFGDNFYPSLSRLYRTNYRDVNDKQQAFVQITSKLTNRNLLPFFEKWGVQVSDETKAIVSQLPPLKTNIWENIINGTHQPLVEWAVPKS